MKTDWWQTSLVPGLFQLSRIISAFCVCFVVCTSGSGVAQEATAAPVEDESPAAEMHEITADSADAAALTYFHDARGLYDRGAYREALVQFRASYALSRRAVLFYNYSLCYQRLREYGDAVNYLERYLLEVVNIPNRADLELRLRRMREAAEDEASTPNTPERRVHPAAWAFFAVTAAGALTALIAGPMALAERSRLNDQPCALTSTCDASTLRRRARITDAGIGVAAAGAVVGVLLLLVLKPSGDAQETVRIDPTFAIDGNGARAGAQLVGHF
ncbi:MAG: hypothetical protein ACI9KE_002255 [Polyangiales bacterium]|jgi:hypothetical protein